ncbi:MAG TPA: DUF1573 domain-containing protein [Gemmatales bacterium]|nr:DUF1573 domain-containing protein [Gemmatales bacterium]
MEALPCSKYLVALGLLLLAQQTLEAQLSFEPLSIDLGDVKAGQIFSQQIKVTNTSSTPITVQEVKASCGCIRPVLEPSTLVPGATGILKLDINTLSSNAGPSTYGIKLRYPESNQLKEQQFIITGRVIQEIIVTPTGITSYGEKPRPQTITILDKRTTPLRPIKLERTSPYLDVEWVQPAVAEPQPQYAVQVSVREDLPGGHHDFEVVIHTNDSAYPVLRVPISVVKKTKARFVASPYLVNLSPNVAASRQVTIRDQHGQGAVIERVEASPGLAISVTNQAAASVTLLVALDKTQPRAMPFDAEVKVYLKDVADPVKILVNVE